MLYSFCIIILIHTDKIIRVEPINLQVGRQEFTGRGAFIAENALFGLYGIKKLLHFFFPRFKLATGLLIKHSWSLNFYFTVSIMEPFCKRMMTNNGWFN